MRIIFVPYDWINIVKNKGLWWQGQINSQTFWLINFLIYTALNTVPASINTYYTLHKSKDQSWIMYFMIIIMITIIFFQFYSLCCLIPHPLHMTVQGKLIQIYLFIQVTFTAEFTEFPHWLRRISSLFKIFVRMTTKSTLILAY